MSAYRADSADIGDVPNQGRKEIAVEVEAQRTFNASMLISAIRCLLTYLLFPFVAPIIGIASGVGSTVGLIASIIGVAANVWSIKRFHSSKHPWRWGITVINVAVVLLLVALFVIDLRSLGVG